MFDEVAPEPVDTDATLSDLIRELGPPAITRHNHGGGRVYGWWNGLRYVELTETVGARLLVDWTRSTPPDVPAAGLGC